LEKGRSAKALDGKDEVMTKRIIMKIEKEYKQIGRRLQALRVASGLTQEDVAGMMKMSRTSVVNIENGNQRILAHRLYEFAAIFDVEPAVIVSDTAIDDAPKIGAVVAKQWAEARKAINAELDKAERAVLKSAGARSRRSRNG
jgi:transcriptional regulator with XRE-family HTH domain